MFHTCGTWTWRNLFRPINCLNNSVHVSPSICHTLQHLTWCQLQTVLSCLFLGLTPLPFSQAMDSSTSHPVYALPAIQRDGRLHVQSKHQIIDWSILTAGHNLVSLVWATEQGHFMGNILASYASVEHAKSRGQYVWNMMRILNRGGAQELG